MGVQIRFYYSTSYNAATNTSTVTLTPYLYTTTTTGGARGYNGSVYGNGSSIYNMAAGYAQDENLYAQNTSSSWQSFTPISGSLSTFTISHNNSGVASFTAGYSGKVRAVYDGTTASVSNATGCSASITESRSLYVSYNANGGSGAPGNTYFYGSTEGITLSGTVPTRTGYTFKGWATSSGASVATYSPGEYIGTRSSGLALYAVWQINTWAVDYDANGGSGAPAAQTKTYGQTLVLSADVPTRTGYTFKGWATTPDASVAQYQPSGNYTANQAATLYAVWQINQYSLSVTKSEAGLALNVTRTESSIAGAATGILSSGDVIYYGDKLTVAYALSAGYAIDTATINGVDMGGTSEAVTVSSNVAVIVLVELQALTYIDNGASIDMYQIYIDDGNSLSAYQAYIDNGVSWDVY